MAFNLKSEEEVKEYLDNLGTEYRFGCFSEKKPEVCHLLGDFLEAIKKDYTKAASVYRSTCDDYSYSRSCHKYAAYSLGGKGCQKDTKKAFEYFKKGCTLGEPDSCLYSGLMCITKNEKNSAKYDFPLGIGFLNQSCDMGSNIGCYYLSSVYLSGVPDESLQPDMKKAFELSTKACSLGNIFACANLSRMYRRGDGVEQSDERADYFKKKTLDMESQLQAKAAPIELQQGS